MGSLASHFTAFLFLFPTGIRRLHCFFSLYLRSPQTFCSRPWYFSDPKWKNADLYVLCVTLPLASFSEIFWFLSVTGDPSIRFSFFQQSAILTLFWGILLLVLLKETCDLIVVSDAILFFLTGVAFLLDYGTSGKESSTGLAGRAYELLAILSLVCSAASFALSFHPGAFFAEFTFSTGMILKGAWFFQSGLSLFTEGFLPKGCHRSMGLNSSKNGGVKCDLEEDGLRGVAIIDLLFLLYALGVLVFAVVLFASLSGKRDARNSSLREMESATMLMHPLPEFEFD